MAPRTAHKKLTILVVDDDREVLSVTVELLQELGYDVIAADNGYRAIDLLRGDEEIDVLLSDICMPGLDGELLAEAAQRLRPDLHIVVTSGGRLPRPGTRFLAKPYHMTDLIALLPRQPAMAGAGGWSHAAD